VKPNGRSSAFDENIRSGAQNPALDHIAIDAKASVVRAQDGSQDIRLLRQLRLRDQGNAAALGLLNDDGADIADMQDGTEPVVFGKGIRYRCLEKDRRSEAPAIRFA